MDGWDLVLLIVASYLAVMSLVRLMLARRNRLLSDLRGQLEAQSQRRKPATPEVKSRDRAA